MSRSTWSAMLGACYTSAIRN